MNNTVTDVPGDMSEGRDAPLRADALRNRARVLEAAEAVFAAEGLAVPVDVIAERACVGVGTLYRHFPTKEKLFEAILLERIVEDHVARTRGPDSTATTPEPPSSASWPTWSRRAR